MCPANTRQAAIKVHVLLLGNCSARVIIVTLALLRDGIDVGVMWESFGNGLQYAPILNGIKLQI